MDTARPSRWLIPGLGALLLLITLLGSKAITHDDLFWHLRTGRLIAETGAVPHADSFSHTLPGAPWVTHEWGFALIVYGTYLLGGYQGLVALTGAAVAAIFVALLLTMRTLVAPGRGGLLFLLLLLGALAAEPLTFVMRAALFSSVFMAILVGLLHLHQASGRRGCLVAAAVVFWIWANVHVGAVIGLSVPAFYWVQGVCDRVRVAPPTLGTLLRTAFGERAWFVLACALVTLINPNGYRLWTFPFELNAILYRSGIRWSMGIFAAPDPAQDAGFFLVVVLCLAACVPLREVARLLRSPTRPLLMQALGTAFFLAMALRSNRFILDFVVFALPLCAARWGKAQDLVGEPRAAEPASPGRAWLDSRRSWVGICGLCFVGVVVLKRPAWPAQPIADQFPQRAVDFLERDHVDGRMFNHVNWGGYIQWRLNNRIYWDGRNDVFAPLAKEYSSNRDFGELVTRYGLSVLVMGRKEYRDNRSFLDANPAFSLVFLDDLAAIYVRRADFEALAARYGLALVRPFALPDPREIRALVQDPARAELVRELEREARQLITQNERSRTGWSLRMMLASARGDRPMAEAARARLHALAGATP